MQNFTANFQANPDERANVVVGSPLLTIEYLRASLLAERSISKAAKGRVDELTKRVKELEEQLKIVSIQRKQAEKTTLDVLSYLESRGVTDVYEVYESECDEESLYESNELKSREDNFGSKALKGNGKESSDSDHESTPSSSGSLSWNGRKKMSQLLQKRNLDSAVSPIQRRTNFPLVDPAPRHHLGKSCRQVKRRERSAGEESRHDYGKSDIQGTNTLESSDRHVNFLDTRGEEMENAPEKLFKRGFRKEESSRSFQGEAQDGDASSSIQGQGCNGEMERTLKHEAQLIGQYTAQEKAQRNWEAKCKDNQVSTVDSWELGDHSDVTEDRDENNPTNPYFGNVAPSHDNGQKAITKTHFQSESPIIHSDSFKLTLRADTGRSEDEMLNARQSSTSPAPDFVFPTLSSNHTQKLERGNSLHEAHFAALSGENTLSESLRVNLDGQRAHLPREGLQWPGEVLNALQGAKLLLNQKLNCLPESGAAEREIRPLISPISDVEWLKVPAACPGLFRVPTDIPSQTPSNSRSLVSHNARGLTDSYLHARAPYLQDYYNMSSPIDSRLNAPSVDAISSSSVYATAFAPARPRVDFHSNTHVAPSSKATISPYSSFPQQMPSNRMLSVKQSRSEAGVSPSISPFYNHNPSIYR